MTLNANKLYSMMESPSISFQTFLRIQISLFVKDYPAIIQAFSTYFLFYACIPKPFKNYLFYTSVYREYINRLFKTLINMTKHVPTINNHFYMLCIYVFQMLKENHFNLHTDYISISRLLFPIISSV